jgi:putative component of membrane protein insertase Oxa1/YidC/SpoIIIJ protein YidD
MLDAVALHSIDAYQRYLSPLKGFACARRVQAGRCSCSEFARRAIVRLGLLPALRLKPARLRACRRSWSILQADGPSVPPGTSPPVENEPCPIWPRPRDRGRAAASLALCCACWPG